MGGTTITIEKDNLIDAIDELIKQRKDIEETYYLFLDSITILSKEDNKYVAIGDKKLELFVGIHYATEKFKKNIVLFAHFGK